jgi:hypothetical protein
MSTPPRSSPRAATARSASARAGSDGSTDLRTAPRATFLRHSPGRPQRSTAPMTRPPQRGGRVRSVRRELARARRGDEASARAQRGRAVPAARPHRDSGTRHGPSCQTRLHYVRGWKRWNRHFADMCRSRLRDSGSAEEERGRELVVGRRIEPAACSEAARHDARAAVGAKFRARSRPASARYRGVRSRRQSQ